MPQIHTHYDNLKVTRNAPPEVIRAAYKSLSQKFHPDRNPNKRDATRTFQIIKSAYEVLSDPVKRKEHDEWIALTEARHNPEAVEAPRPERYATPAAMDTSTPLKDMFREIPFVVQGIQQRYRSASHSSRGFLKLRRNPRYLVISACWLLAATLIVFGILAA
jgi:DnaJ-class molecular chaperone